MKAIVKVEFVMNFTPNAEGRCSTEIKFSLPGHPKVRVPEDLQRMAIEHASQLCHAMLTHEDGIPASPAGSQPQEI